MHQTLFKLPCICLVKSIEYFQTQMLLPFHLEKVGVKVGMCLLSMVKEEKANKKVDKSSTMMLTSVFQGFFQGSLRLSLSLSKSRCQF